MPLRVDTLLFHWQGQGRPSRRRVVEDAVSRGDFRTMAPAGEAGAWAGVAGAAAVDRTLHDK
ncbi:MULTISPECIES: hypothetical protein [Streptomyces]|uniref:hypothetical protein n=1 Tax=Streptomyces TaxID=1883 RepID=UPI0007CD9DD4|nr:hypothetical protein A4V12_31585 [Streptomyces noursei]